MKIWKIAIITLVAAVLVVVLGGAIAVGERTYSYMSRQNFDFNTALQWAVDDYKDFANSIFGKEDNTILEFDFCNKHIEVTACTSH